MQPRRTSTDYGNPYRPAAVRACNLAGRGLERVGLRARLDRPGLVDAARGKTGLQDFGSPCVEEPLDVLTGAVEREAQLHPLGRLITRQRLVGILANRLRFTKICGDNPEIARWPLPPVILITGLQRTGTTLLHRLLAADPRVRSLRSWEAIQPVPLLADREKDTARRRSLALRGERALSYLAPDFFAIHPVQADAPEEDVLLLDYAFMSTVPESMLHVPAYAAWAEGQDNRPAYELLRAFLKLLTWQDPAPVWVLKTPHHLEHLGIVWELFPEVTVVQTHRDPAVTLPSFCSMIAHSRGVFSDHVDADGIGKQLLHKTAYMVHAGLNARKKNPGHPCVDIHYKDLIRDPLGQVKRIYEAAGMTLTEEAAQRVEACLSENRQHRYGVHRYRLQDFGLSREAVYDAYAGYMDTFNVSTEQT